MKFYANKGRRCAQVAIKSVATEDSVSLRKLDKITGRGKNQITTPIQIAYGLFQLGVDFIYPVKLLFLKCPITSTDERYLRLFGKDNIKKTNFGFIEKARKDYQEIEAIYRYILR